MSIASEITRLQNAKASIKTSIEAKGVTVPSSAKLDSYSSYVDQISSGGGGDEERIVKLIGNNLTSIIPSDFYVSPSVNVSTISTSAFRDKTNITSVTMPEGVISYINDYAFCNTGITSFTIPTYTQSNNTRWNGSHILASSKNLQTIDLTNAFMTHAITYFETNQTSAPSSTDGFINLTNITFPSTVSNLFYTTSNESYYGLANTTSLTSITLPEPTSAITNNYLIGFLYNSGISSAYVSNGVNVIAISMFEKCQNLTSVSLPSTLTKINLGAFKDCPLLTSLTFRGTMAQWGNVEKVAGWKNNTPLTKVSCTDGDVALLSGETIYWNSYVLSDFVFSTTTYGSKNGADMWWNGEQLQIDNLVYDSSRDSWRQRTNTKTSQKIFTDGVGIYRLGDTQNQVFKYDAVASHAGTADVWTTLSIPTPGTSAYVIRIGNDIYYSDNTNGRIYKWLGEASGFSSTYIQMPTDFKSWNVWTPDEQHWFFTGSNVTATKQKNYIWDATNETFVAWNDSNIQCQGMGFFYYKDNTGNHLYYAQASTSKIYEPTIDYVNQTITLTETSKFSGVPSLTNGPNKFWDLNGTRCLCANEKPRKTN